MVKLAGGVLAWFGVGAAFLFFWMVYKALSLPGPVHAAVYGMLGLSALLAFFCLTVGWRLYLNRPNRHGSSLGPTGWRVLGALFGLAGVAMLGFAALLPYATVDVRSLTALSGAGCLVFCYWSFRLARRS